MGNTSRNVMNVSRKNQTPFGKLAEGGVFINYSEMLAELQGCLIKHPGFGSFLIVVLHLSVKYVPV
jgi:hypothetical protein